MYIEDKIKFTLLAVTLFICKGRAHNVLMYSFDSDTLHSLWFVTLIKMETHYSPSSSNTHQHPSSALSFSLTHINIYKSTGVHIWIRALSLIHLHGPLGSVTQRAWPNGEMIGSERCVMVLCLLYMEIERFDRLGQVNRAEWLPWPWLKRHKRVGGVLTNAIIMLLLLITAKEVDARLFWVPVLGCVTESTEGLNEVNEALHPSPLDPISSLRSAINAPLWHH